MIEIFLSLLGRENFYPWKEIAFFLSLGGKETFLPWIAIDQRQAKVPIMPFLVTALLNVRLFTKGKQHSKASLPQLFYYHQLVFWRRKQLAESFWAFQDKIMRAHNHCDSHLKYIGAKHAWNERSMYYYYLLSLILPTLDLVSAWYLLDANTCKVG